jgi:hypothetical protein
METRTFAGSHDSDYLKGVHASSAATQPNAAFFQRQPQEGQGQGPPLAPSASVPLRLASSSSRFLLTPALVQSVIAKVGQDRAFYDQVVTKSLLDLERKQNQSTHAFPDRQL